MLTILRQNKEKLRSAVESAVLNQCQAILGDAVTYQIEGLIGITEVNADEVILVKVLHNLTKPEKCDNISPAGDPPAVVDVKKEAKDDQGETMGNMEGHVSDLINPSEIDSPHKFSDTLFGEFNMRQDIGGENLSLSVESFQDSFTDINMSTSESSESLSDTTKHTEDDSDHKVCDSEHDLNNGSDRSLQTPEPRDHIDMDSITVKIEKPSEVKTTSQMKFTNGSHRNSSKIQRHKSKVKQFPERFQEQRQRDAERMRMRRRLRQSQMTEEERQRQRERWRDKKRKQRLKRKLTRDSKSESCSEHPKDGATECPDDKSSPEQKRLFSAVPSCQSRDGATNGDNGSPNKPAVSDSSTLLSTLKEKPQLTVSTPDALTALASHTATQSNMILQRQSTKPPDSLGSPLNWHMSSNGHGPCDQELLSHNAGSVSGPWRRDPVSSCLTVSQLPNRNSIASQIRQPFPSGQLNPQPLFDLTRDDCHIRPQFNVHSSLQGGHRPMSHGPPMSYTSTNGPSYPAFSIPYMNTQSSFSSTGFKSPYIKAEPGLGDQPCCNLSGPNPTMNPYVGYKHFNSNAGIHSWDQSNTMPNLDMSLIKQEPVSAYNNWL